MLAQFSRRGFSLLAAGAALAGAALSAGRRDRTPTIGRSPAEWRRLLGRARYHVLREAGTEPPYSSELLNETRKGIFACAGCGLPLFSSSAKFVSGTGWPSFSRALPGAVGYRRDLSLGMVRTEEHCRRCGGHLGQMFDDGPPPTRKRHCINGLSLRFRPI